MGEEIEANSVFTKRKMEEYEALKAEIDTLEIEAEGIQISGHQNQELTEIGITK